MSQTESYFRKVLSEGIMLLPYDSSREESYSAGFVAGLEEAARYFHRRSEEYKATADFARARGLEFFPNQEQVNATVEVQELAAKSYDYAAFDIEQMIAGVKEGGPLPVVAPTC